MSLLLTRADEAASGIPPYLVFDIIMFIALGVSLFTLIPAVFSPNVHRMKSWLGLIVACILYCVSFLVLVGHQSGKEPSLSFCTFQAGLIYAAPPGLAAAALGFVIELCLRFQLALSPMKETLTRKLDKRAIYLLLISPILHEIVFWSSVFTGLTNTSSIGRHSSGMYCRIDHPLPTLMAGVTVILLLLGMFGMEVYTVYLLVRSYRGAHSYRVSGAYFPTSLFIRTSVYTFIGGLGMILVTVTVNAKSGETNYTLLNAFAVIPLSVGLLFGTQTDILRVYFCFWRKKRPGVNKDIV